MPRYFHGHHYDRVSVYGCGVRGPLRAHMIQRFLPGLWHQAYHSISVGHLDLDEYADLDRPYGRQAMKLVYKYLKDSESGLGKSIILSEGLEEAWLRSRRGSDDALNLFSALCRLFDNWGCHEEFFNALESFFSLHSREIVKRRFGDWIDYINELDSICPDRRRDLTKALGHVVQHRSLGINYLRSLSHQHILSPEVVYLLEELLEKKRKRRSQKRAERGGIGSRDLIHRGVYSGALDYPRTDYSRPAIDYDGEYLHHLVEHERDRLEVIEPPRIMPPFLGQPFPIHSQGCPNSISSISDYLGELALDDRPQPYLGDDISHNGRAINDPLGVRDLDPFYSSERLGIME